MSQCTKFSRFGDLRPGIRVFCDVTVSKEPVGLIAKCSRRKKTEFFTDVPSKGPETLSDAEDQNPPSHLVTRNCERLLSAFNVKTIVRDDDPTWLLQI